MISRRTIVFTLAAGPLLAGGLPALAKSGHSSPIRMFDMDNDGTVDLAEAKKAASASFDKLDRDRDGTLDKRELARRLTLRANSRLSSVPSRSRSNLSNDADAAFFASARSTVPSLSISNIRIGLEWPDFAKAGNPPASKGPAASVKTIVRRDIMGVALSRFDLYYATPLPEVCSLAQKYPIG